MLLGKQKFPEFGVNLIELEFRVVFLPQIMCWLSFHWDQPYVVVTANICVSY